MDYNYHTHTYRCSHAVGTEEEYIKRAIDGGIKYMGFSDHIPLVFPDGSQSYYRVPAEMGNEYIATIKALAEKYKNQIDIKVGFESEYYPEFFEDTVKYAKEIGAEYLILGQHFSNPECYPYVRSTTKSSDNQRLTNYVNDITEAMKTGVFTYVAHPDILNFSGDINFYKDEIRKLCTLSSKLNIPLEINFLGIRENRNYPLGAFWEVCGEVGSPVTFGFDAHDVMSAYDGESLKVAERMVSKYNLNYIGKPKLILL